MWHWLTHPKEPYTWGFISRVVIKATLLFIAFNLLFDFFQPMDAISRLSLYNRLFVGRERLPYGENPTEAYTLTMDSVPAMFATHEINRAKADDEYRVLLVGDSATWGFLLQADETLASQLSDMGYLLADGRRVVAYNIGHPVMSLTKDLLLLDEAMNYQPDMVIWLVTLQSFSDERRLSAPIIYNNPERVRDLISTYGLSLNPDDKGFKTADFFGQTVIGQRRMIADWLRIQLYGVMWSTTGIDHVVNDYTLRRSDFDTDISWENFDDPTIFTADDIGFDIIRAGHERAGEIPLIIVNEPMFISTGQNSDLRYNNFYPRWAYDSYRVLFAELATANNWQYCDLWDAIPAESFTDSPVHMTAEATGDVSRLLGETLTDYLDFGYLGRDCD